MFPNLIKVYSYKCYLKVKVREETDTLQPLYNTVRYNTVLDITWVKDGSQKYIDYIEK